ncbi:MAG TPA: hypothetical protein PLP29_17770 [Candidatus Ozemobacteraceae bacterium]|nr:hypothetical protein [Candidatus Ozemobacteraceae bacterium]
MIKRFAVATLMLCCMGSAAFGWQWDTQAPAGDQKGNFGKWQVSKRLSGSIGAWRSELHGDLDVEGLKIDLQGDGDFNDRSVPTLQLAYTLSKRSRLWLEYVALDHDGAITKQVTFDNQTYSAGAKLNLTNRWFDLGGARLLKVYGDPAKIKTDPSHIEVLYGIKFSRASVDVAGTDNLGTQVSDSWDESFPIPYIGVGGRARFTDAFGVNGRLKYLSVNSGGDSARTYDYAVEFEWRLNPLTKNEQWFLTAGWRGYLIDGESDTNSIEVGYRGPVVSLTGRF